MTEKLRRAVPRQPADWFDFYRFDNVHAERWRCCRVIDISPTGTGLELFEIEPGECIDSALTISVELHGDTRYMVIDDENHTARVGVQFPAPTEAAKEYMRSISGTRSRW